LLRLRLTASIFWLYFENLKIRLINYNVIYNVSEMTPQQRQYFRPILWYCVMTTCNPLNGGCQCFGLVVLPPSSVWVSSIQMRTELHSKRRYTTYYLNQKHYYDVQNPSLDSFFSHINIVVIITHTHTHTHTHTTFFKMDFRALLLSASGSLMY